MLEGPFLYEIVLISFWIPENAYGTHSLQQYGISLLSNLWYMVVTCLPSAHYCHDSFAVPLSFTGKQWLINLYLCLYYHNFINIIKVIYPLGWQVLVYIISICMETPNLNQLCYALLHTFSTSTVLSCDEDGEGYTSHWGNSYHLDPYQQLPSRYISPVTFVLLFSLLFAFLTTVKLRADIFTELLIIIPRSVFWTVIASSEPLILYAKWGLFFFLWTTSQTVKFICCFIHPSFF